MTIKKTQWIFVKMSNFHTIWMHAYTQDKLPATIEAHNQSCLID